MDFKSNVIKICCYCGEKGVSGKYCRTCSTKQGREKVFEANKEALMDLRKHNFCLGEVLLQKP